MNAAISGVGSAIQTGSSIASGLIQGGGQMLGAVTGVLGAGMQASGQASAGFNLNGGFDLASNVIRGASGLAGALLGGGGGCVPCAAARRRTNLRRRSRNLGKPRPRKTKPSKPNPRKSNLKKSNQRKTNPKIPNPRKPNPRKPNPRKPKPMKPNPRKSNLKKPNPRKPNPKIPNPRKPNPRIPNPRKPNPRKPSPRKARAWLDGMSSCKNPEALDDAEGLVLGWGKEDYGIKSNVLREVTMPILSNHECRIQFK